MIAIIDYGIGNLRSVHNAVSFISPKTKSIVTSDPDVVDNADRVIFPGQGAMPDCILQLEKRGLKESVIEAAKQKPFLGICLGLQMKKKKSEEGNVSGFGLLPGTVKRFQLNKNERISFNVIGILKNLSEEELKKYNKSSGVKISDFNKRYEKYWRDYGIEIGNIINSINGVDIKSISDVQNILNDMNNYDPLRIEIINSNGEMERFNFR